MATAPYFVISPTTVLSIIGLVHGPDRTEPAGLEDWRRAVVDVVIPALNEEQHVVLCLQSIARQTLQPRQVILVDDGSRDRTSQYAKAFAAAIGLNLVVIRRRRPIGKTPTLKRQAREFDPDVEVILDGDTVLESANYLERLVQELYKGPGVASACGVVLPLRVRDRRRWLHTAEIERFLAANPDIDLKPRESRLHRFDRALTNLYREILYVYLQRFLYRGQMVFFGTITNPVGCAVAYRRKYLQDLFDLYEPLLGDDLTNSEDIFIGFALLDQGYRNVQVGDVCARTIEPEVQGLPRQIYHWSSSFLQSCYYFDELVRSPFKAIRRYRHRRREKQYAKQAGRSRDRRRAREPYRQPFGIDYTKQFGRPMGWIIFTAALEKITFPTVLLVMILYRLWTPLLVTVVAESTLSLAILLLVSHGHRFEMLWKGAAVVPLRYASLAYDAFTIGRFATDLWITGSRRWRK